jgi:CRISPR-associated endonuclease Csn1
MKKILGLDLGTTSIGWAYVHESENDAEQSQIIDAGVRVVPLTTDEEADFTKGNPITINAERTLKRGMRRNLDRYQMRRSELIAVLKREGIIDENTTFNEEGENSIHSSYALRARAASQEISLTELVRVLLMINKKRGYKSSRKAQNEEEGQAIDGMHVAKKMHEAKQTPGQYVFNLLEEGKKVIPEFYRSDLENEFDRVWKLQQSHYPELFNEANHDKLKGRKRNETATIFTKVIGIELAENKEKGSEAKLKVYTMRSRAVTEKVEPGEAALVLTEINNNLNASSGYLGAISDRSKKLFFNHQTVGQYQYELLKADPHTSLVNMVFYRQDYMDEFDKVWNTQAKHHPKLTDALRDEIRNRIIFYQRRLKSAKHLLAFCEFEKGHRVIPKSSPLFQEAKVWQVVNNLEFTNQRSHEKRTLSIDDRNLLFQKLNIIGNVSDKELMKILGLKSTEWEVNFKEIEGNRTNKALYNAFIKIAATIHGEEIEADKTDAHEMKNMLMEVFSEGGISTDFFHFDGTIGGNDFDKQPSCQLWHMLYSIEDPDDLIPKLCEKFGFQEHQARILSNINLPADYGSLSSRALRKVLPNLQLGMKYSDSCTAAGYNHSASLTKEQNLARQLNDHLEILPKNSLRNPVVEKILNQMVNVVNAIIDDSSLGKPDEIRVEMARELKKSAKERKEMTTNIQNNQRTNELHEQTLMKEFGLKRVTRNDIIRYKLYLELKPIGFKSLYTNEYIPADKLFSKEYDIEHIIPQSRLFDDSLSNKTIVERKVNIEKGNATAYDYMKEKYGEQELENYKARIWELLKNQTISRPKQRKLLMAGDAIPDNFIDRDLRNTQYIAKKSREMLEAVCRTVSPTIGSITDRLREDWQLINVMQELNWPKYEKLGLTYYEEDKEGKPLRRIKDWTKRNDHRHHAMDAITVAFTKHSFIQYLNNLNAQSKKAYGIEQKELMKDQQGRLIFKPPMPIDEFRARARFILESILVSFKAKNKVVTKNKNRIKTPEGIKTQVVLTPRGQMHNETIYGSIQTPVVKEEKVGGRFDEATIACVTSPAYREALLKRLRENNNDPKKAFTGSNTLAKKPLWLDDMHVRQVPETVKLKWYENQYTIRKAVAPDLNVEKVLDKKVKVKLEVRLAAFGNDPKKAFVNLEEKPIWMDEARGIAIKRVRITGVNNAEALHERRDHRGQPITGPDGRTIPADFVSTSNNHHAAIYMDNEGNLQDEIVPFIQAVWRAKEGIPIISKQHEKGWKFLFSIKQNEMFVLPSSTFNPAEIDLNDPVNRVLISQNLFRVQKFSKLFYGHSPVRDYTFRHHLETVLNDTKELKDISYRSIKSLPWFIGAVKVRINHLGRIIHVGEY